MRLPSSLAAMMLVLASGSALFAASTSAATPPAAPASSTPPPDAPPPGDPAMDPHDGPRGHGPGMHMRSRHGAMPILRMLHGLDLSDAQRDSIHQLLEKNREPHRALMERRFELRRAFFELDPVAPDYQKKADKIGADAARLAQETVHFDARVTSEVVALLTPDQTKQLQAKLAERREHRDAGDKHP